MLGNYNIQSDDLISVVRLCIQDMLFGYKCFTGQVISVESDGTAKVWSKQYNNAERNESEKHFNVKPANKFYSSIFPKTGDNVLFFFMDGLNDARYFAIDSVTTQNTSIEGTNQYVIFQKTNQKYFLFDDNAEKFILKIGDGKMEMTENKVEFTFGGIKTTIDSGGINTDAGGGIDYTTHTHTGNLGAQTSPPTAGT